MQRVNPLFLASALGLWPNETREAGKSLTASETQPICERPPHTSHSSPPKHCERVSPFFFVLPNLSRVLENFSRFFQAILSRKKQINELEKPEFAGANRFFVSLAISFEPQRPLYVGSKRIVDGIKCKK